MDDAAGRRSKGCAGGRPGRQVLVLGGAGFIGRHAVAALLARGAEVIVASRRPVRIDHRLPEEARRCQRRQARLELLLRHEDWHALLSDCDAVLNCVGILRQRGRETYDRVHHRAPAALARACCLRGLPLIHVSALGLHDGARSRFLRSKLRGERALLASGADVRIVRPSLLDGAGGFGARWLRRIARFPVHALPSDATGRIAALDVRDLGEALARLALDEIPPALHGHREIELGGSDLRTLREHLQALRALEAAKPAHTVAVPGWIARIGSHICDVLHWSPFSFGHWELLRRDNSPQANRLVDILGRAPRPVGAPAFGATRAPARLELA